MRLAGAGAYGLEARLEGLQGATRVEEVLHLAVEALGLAGSGKTGLRVGARELRGEETLAEVGVGAGGAEELWVGVGLEGGMPTGGGVLGALDALQAQMSGFVSVLDLAEQQVRAPKDTAPDFLMTGEVTLMLG